MRIANRTLSIADLRRLGAFEIYEAAQAVALGWGQAAMDETPSRGAVDEDLSFRIGQQFASPTKIHRLLWLAGVFSDLRFDSDRTRLSLSRHVGVSSPDRSRSP